VPGRWQATAGEDFGTGYGGARKLKKHQLLYYNLYFLFFLVWRERNKSLNLRAFLDEA